MTLQPHSAWIWTPTIMRGALWVAIAMLKCYLDAMHHATKEQVQTWGWFGWSVLVVSVLLEGCMAMRLYLDQSLSDHKKKLANENLISPDPPVNS